MLELQIKIAVVFNSCELNVTATFIYEHDILKLAHLKVSLIPQFALYISNPANANK